MGKYLDGLTPEQLNNLEFIIKRMHEKGITNPYMQAGIMAVVSKESSFKPSSERDYSRTSNDRIRKIFGRRVSDLNDDQLTALKNDPESFFNKIYGGRYGNAANEGYKYRGRGLNQLTFKGNYEQANNSTDVDIVKFPDKVNELSVATDVLIGFFKRHLSSSKARLSEYNMTDFNSAKSTADAVEAAYNANAGWGKSKTEIEKDPTGGYKKAKARVDELYALAISLLGNTGSPVEKPVEPSTGDIIAKGKVTASRLNVRSGAGINYGKIGSLKNGTEVEIYERRNGWLRIGTNKWVSGNYVKV